MTFQVGDSIRYIAHPTQIGVVERNRILGVYGIVVNWNVGPVWPSGKSGSLFFGPTTEQFELNN